VRVLHRIQRLGHYLTHPTEGVFRAFQGRSLPAALRTALRFPNRREVDRQLGELRSRYADRPAVVFPLPSCPWSYLFQRPQQMARALARAGYLVIYCVHAAPPYPVDMQVRGLQEIEPGLVLFNDGLGSAALQALDGSALIWQYWPHQSPMLSRHLPGCPRVYDCLDRLEVFAGSRRRLREAHQALMSSAPVVVASSRLLVEQVARQRADVLELPNACDYEHFEQSRHLPAPTEFTPPGELRIGYFGAISHWLDGDLLTEVARRRANDAFLLVGDAYGDDGRHRRLARLNNVYVHPRQPYDRLPEILAAFDVAIIPFRVNEITAATSPIKLFEYLAGGRPVVSTDLAEARRYDTVFIASDAAAFASAIDSAAVARADAIFRQQMELVARANTWSARAAELIAHLRCVGLPVPRGGHPADQVCIPQRLG
jgi:glycosyltransferase involved in cell wall biosynthesis